MSSAEHNRMPCSQRYLGDGTTALRFMTSLSDYYLGFTPALVPTFEKYLQPPPALERHLVDDAMHLAPQLAEDMPFASFLASIYQNMATTSRIQVKFTATQLKAIRVTANLEATTKISTSDALAGYLVTVLNKISPVTIENITNIISVGLVYLLFSANTHLDSFSKYRGIEAAPGHKYTPPPFTSAGNVILNLTPVKKIPANARNSIGCAATFLDMQRDANGRILRSSLIASFIRNGIEQARDPECARRLAALFDESFTRTLGRGRIHDWSLPPDRCQFNNMFRYASFSTFFNALHYSLVRSGSGGRLEPIISATKEKLVSTGIIQFLKGILESGKQTL